MLWYDAWAAPGEVRELRSEVREFGHSGGMRSAEGGVAGWNGATSAGASTSPHGTPGLLL